MANPSLSEYLAQSQRGLYQSVFGPEYLMKQSYFTVDSATGIFNTTYGRKVWQALIQCKNKLLNWHKLALVHTNLF